MNFDNYVITLTNENLGQIHLFDSRVNVINLNIKQGKIKTITGFYETLRSLIKIINNIIHSHHEHYVTFFIQLASNQKLINIRTVHSGGSFYSNQEKLSDKIKLYIEKLTFLLFNVNLIAVSKAIHQNNIKYFGKLVQDNILIHNGADLNRFKNDKYIHIEKKQFDFSEKSIMFLD